MADRHKGLENQYQGLLDLANTEPLQAAMNARELLRSSKKAKSYTSTIRQLDKIINGDQSAWHYGAKDLTQAVQFIISNMMLKSAGLGVMHPGTRNEDIATDQAIRVIDLLISEGAGSVNLTSTQRRLKQIAESYGFNVYMIGEGGITYGT